MLDQSQTHGDESSPVGLEVLAVSGLFVDEPGQLGEDVYFELALDAFLEDFLNLGHNFKQHPFPF